MSLGLSLNLMDNNSRITWSIKFIDSSQKGTSSQQAEESFIIDQDNRVHFLFNNYCH